MFKKRSKNLLDIVGTLIGRNAVLEGTIKTAEVVRIDGKIKGNIDALGVLIGTEAEVVGDIKTNILTIAEGAYFEGKCSMITKETACGAEKK